MKVDCIGQWRLKDQRYVSARIEGSIMHALGCSIEPNHACRRLMRRHREHEP